MRTSFHHQSEAQSPNGPLTAATSPDTPSPGPTTQSRRNGSFHETAKKVRQFRSLAGHGALSPVSLSGLRGLLREFVLGVS